MKTPGYSEFLNLFGSLTVFDVAQLILAGAFLYFVGKAVIKFILSRYEAAKKKDSQLQLALDTIQHYPEWRKQSLDVQESLTNSIKALQQAQTEIVDRIDKMEEGNRKRKLNELRASLIKSYQYYTSEQYNPSKSWTQMEADSFWASFGDYEELDGDGYMHSVVQPAMLMLSVISMDDMEAISQLMKSRR